MDRQESDRHVREVRCLRTELHHNLGYGDSDLAARTVAELWRRRACGTAVPRTTAHWKACYARLVGDAHSFLRGIDEVVRRLESNGLEAQSSIHEWHRRLERIWTASAFDSLIEEAKNRLALEALNTVVFS